MCLPFSYSLIYLIHHFWAVWNKIWPLIMSALRLVDQSNIWFQNDHIYMVIGHFDPCPWSKFSTRNKTEINTFSGRSIINNCYWERTRITTGASTCKRWKHRFDCKYPKPTIFCKLKQLHFRSWLRIFVPSQSRRPSPQSGPQTSRPPVRMRMVTYIMVHIIRSISYGSFHIVTKLGPRKPVPYGLTFSI